MTAGDPLGNDSERRMDASIPEGLDEKLDWYKFLEEIFNQNPQLIHYRLRENVTPCIEAGDRRFVDCWGQYITGRKELVGCQFCLEWLHA